MKAAIRRVTVGLIIIGATATIAFGADDPPCIPCMQGASVGNSPVEKASDEIEGEFEASTQEAMEWQCIIVDIIIGDCIDWDSEPCPLCYYPCIGGCGVACEAAVVAGCAAAYATTGVVPDWCKYLGIGCIYGCDFICNGWCPQCQYCVEHETTIVKSCGWVFTE